MVKFQNLKELESATLEGNEFYTVEGFSASAYVKYVLGDEIDCLINDSESGMKWNGLLSRSEFNKKLTTKYDGQVRHARYNTIMSVLKKGQAAYLCGPAGSGKNHVGMQIAKELGLEFYFASTLLLKSDLVGHSDIHGNLVETEFYRAALNGGLFFLDEFDGCAADVAIGINAALANGYIDFPVVGRVNLNENFRCICAGNTAGTGATLEFAGRQTLDAATLDRFCLVHFGYDTRIEEMLAKGNQEILSFVRELRKLVRDNQVMDASPLGYRAIQRLATFLGELPDAEVIEMAIIKGMSIDTQRMLGKLLKSWNGENRYVKAWDDVEELCNIW